MNNISKDLMNQIHGKDGEIKNIKFQLTQEIAQKN